MQPSSMRDSVIQQTFDKYSMKKSVIQQTLNEKTVILKIFF